MAPVCQRYTKGMSEVCPKYIQRHARGIPEVYPKACQRYVIEGLYLQVDPLKNSPINRKKPKTQIHVSDSYRDNLESKFQDDFV
jgi:hypothetical protein